MDLQNSISRPTSFYQTSHLVAGFIADPAGQLKVLANSSMFDNDPFTLKKHIKKKEIKIILN